MKTCAKTILIDSAKCMSRCKHHRKLENVRFNEQKHCQNNEQNMTPKLRSAIKIFNKNLDDTTDSSKRDRVALLSNTLGNLKHSFTPDQLPIGIDSCASATITFSQNYFIGKINPCKM